jgi:hypothetical protein
MPDDAEGVREAGHSTLKVGFLVVLAERPIVYTVQRVD